jgi:cysteine desulfurase
MTFARVLGEEVLANAPEVAASTGSACHAGKTEPSPVLMHMRFYPNRALGAVRMSLGRWSREEEVERAAKLLAQSVESVWQKS